MPHTVIHPLHTVIDHITRRPHTILKALFCILALGVFAAPAGAEKPDPRDLANERDMAGPRDLADERVLTDDLAAFAADLHARLSASEGNLFYSPFSISAAMAMTAAGAGGKTLDQMRDALRLTQPLSRLHDAFGKLTARLDTVGGKNVQLRIANSLWPQQGYPFKPDYIRLIKTAYGAQVHPADYQADTEAARQAINQWVAEATAGKIPKMVPPGTLDSLTRLALINAIHFKGDWKDPFPEADTHAAPFHLQDGKTVEATLMTQQADFAHAAFPDYQVLALPYAGEALSMIALLPRAPDGLPALETALFGAPSPPPSPGQASAGAGFRKALADWDREMTVKKARVYLPRFTIASEFRLDKALADMGMPDAFRPGVADFSGMDGRKDWLSISAVLHKAFVAVDETGTEAAAATAVAIAARSLGPPMPVFRADHPFLFLIRENATGAILFMGRVTDPS